MHRIRASWGALHSRGSIEAEECESCLISFIEPARIVHKDENARVASRDPAHARYKHEAPILLLYLAVLFAVCLWTLGFQATLPEIA